MARSPKARKIATDAAQPSGLDNPFAGLDLGALPAGPALAANLEGAEGYDESGSHKTAKPVRTRGRVVLRRETAHRAGKAVVIVGDIPAGIPAAEIAKLAHDLKKQCGAGGTVRGREIEIQGEHAPRIRAYLETQGFKVAGV